MRNNAILILILVTIVSLFCNTNALAEYQGDEYIYFGDVKKIGVTDLNKIPYGQKPINKLDRGLVNTATFWMEMPAEMAKVSREQNAILGVTAGAVQGLFASVVRAGSGLFDTFTFFMPPYDKPIVKPEYAMNRADEEMRELFW